MKRGYDHPDKLKRQAEYDDSNYHPKEKKDLTQRIQKIIEGKSILEVFAGQGNLTPVYKSLSDKVLSLTWDKGIPDTQYVNCSYKYINAMASRHGRPAAMFDVIDIDGNGFSEDLFPQVFSLIKNHGVLIYTAPMHCQAISAGQREQFNRMFGTKQYPQVDDIMYGLKKYAQVYNMELFRKDFIGCCGGYGQAGNGGGMTRQVFRVRKSKAKH